jgi:hypothetical protein
MIGGVEDDDDGQTGGERASKERVRVRVRVRVPERERIGVST